MLKRIVGRLLVALLRSPTRRAQADRLFRWYARYFAAAANAGPQPAATDVETGVIPETIRLPARRSDLGGARLNLCIPSLQARHAFGGVATALQLFDALSERFTHTRIVVTGPDAEPSEFVEKYTDWKITNGSDSDVDGHVVLHGKDRRISIPVRKNDYFIATAWWTARLVRDLVRWQKAEYGLGGRRYAYLIQDYEPGFHPWSSRYVLAEATYRNPKEIVAVFNTRLLREHFEHAGYHFDRDFAFEPQFNRQLAAYRERSARREKLRTIVVYGRPGTPRNGFPLIVEALQAWARDYPGAAKWRVVSAGESHTPVPLAWGLEIQALGKLALADYADLLDVAAIGITLMISPHPSYPPLEMAAFGMRVITNGYGVKDLSKVHEGIVSVAIPEPENIADELRRLCEAFDSAPWSNRGPGFIGGTFLQGGEPFPFLDSLRRALDGGPDLQEDAKASRLCS